MCFISSDILSNDKLLSNSKVFSNNINLSFTDDALRQVSYLAEKENETSENLGARRLHNIMEELLEDISFNANGEHQLIDIVIDKEYVDKTFADTTKKYDLTKYII